MTSTAKKHLTIWGALAAAVATAIGVVVTPTVVTWTAITVGLGLAGKLTGWGQTEAIKRLVLLPPPGRTVGGRAITQREYWNTEEGKRRIYAWAILGGWLWTELGGVIFLLATSSRDTHTPRST